MAISVKLEVFEGPLDLLLHLIEKNKIDIYDIPIVMITEQYLDYIKQMETEDMNIMSEFLVMAATLLDIKCRMLLPKEVNEEGEEESPKMIRGVSAGENYYDISIYAMTNEEYSAIMELIESAEKINRYDMDIIEIILEETQQFFAGEQSAEDTAKFIQSRVNLYVNEQR